MGRTESKIMTQEEQWQSKYSEVRTFIETNRRNPSKHRVEEHRLLNWIKHNRKMMHRDAMRPDRVEKFKALLELGEQHKRLNQYA